MKFNEEWRKGVVAIFDEIRKHKKPYNIIVSGVKLVILPNVFSPRYFTDSEWFALKISKIVGKSKLLEIGTGTGIIALFAALNGASVVATDINPQAVKNAKLNFKNYGFNIPVFLSDIYDALNLDEKFDFVFWNHPFNKGTKKEDILLQAGIDYKYKSLEKYIAGAKDYLNMKGRLLLGTANFADLDSVNILAKKYGYHLILLDSVKMPLGEGEDFFENEYLIYELKNE